MADNSSTTEFQTGLTFGLPSNRSAITFKAQKLIAAMNQKNSLANLVR